MTTMNQITNMTFEPMFRVNSVSVKLCFCNFIIYSTGYVIQHFVSFIVLQSSPQKIELVRVLVSCYRGRISGLKKVFKAPVS